MNKKIYLLLVLIAFVLSACGETAEEESFVLEGEAFELYFVADQTVTGGNLHDYDLEDLPINDKPFLSTKDVVSYMWGDHAVNLTEEAYLKIVVNFSQGLPLDGLPFVIVSNNQRIYAGVFMSLVSSLIFDGVVIQQPFDPAIQPLFLTLGYPNEAFFTGEDPRGNTILRQALEAAELIVE